MDGQLLVRFPDGTSHACEQTSGWSPFDHHGTRFEWCEAEGHVRSATLEAIVAVRRSGSSGPLLGATYPTRTNLSEMDARSVVDAFGGASSFEASAPSTKRIANARPSRRQLLSRSLGFISDMEVTTFLSQQYRVPTIDLGKYEIDVEVLKLVPKALCDKLRVLPVSRAGASLIVAMADPTNDAAIAELGASTSFKVEPVIASEQQIYAAIARYYTNL